MSDRKPPKIIFLDQNKWIDLAHAFDDPTKHPSIHAVGQQMITAVTEGRAIFPLTANLLIETYKMKDDAHRKLVAEVQAQFSQGYVYRDRNFRIRQELMTLIRNLEGFPDEDAPIFWFLSKYFIEAFTDIPNAVKQAGLEMDQIEGIQSNPKFALFHWLATVPESEQTLAMQEYEKGSEQHIKSIEHRIGKLKDQKLPFRLRAYSALLLLEELPRIFSVANANGIPWNDIPDVGDQKLKRLMREVPSYSAEIELTCRIELMNRKIETNDLRDMSAYVAALPNSDILVGEKLFINLAKQSQMHKRFENALFTDIKELVTYL